MNPSLLLYGLANSEAFIQAAEKYNVTLVQEALQIVRISKMEH